MNAKATDFFTTAHSKIIIEVYASIKDLQHQLALQELEELRATLNCNLLILQKVDALIAAQSATEFEGKLKEAQACLKALLLTFEDGEKLLFARPSSVKTRLRNIENLLQKIVINPN